MILIGFASLPAYAGGSKEPKAAPGYVKIPGGTYTMGVNDLFGGESRKDP